MTEITVIVVCGECRTFWPEDSETPACANSAHRHARREMHRHRTPVVLPDGTSIVAVSFDQASPYERSQPPDFGVYLDHRWDPPWSHEHVEWPDFGLPADTAALRQVLNDAIERAAAGAAVEVGCLGGHGRTGTAIACMAVLAGAPATEAVDWVRANYCEKAVETPEQVTFVSTFARE